MDGAEGLELQPSKRSDSSTGFVNVYYRDDKAHEKRPYQARCYVDKKKSINLGCFAVAEAGALAVARYRAQAAAARWRACRRRSWRIAAGCG